MHAEQKRFFPTKKKLFNYDHPLPHTVKKYLNNDRRFEFFGLSRNVHSIIIIINQRECPFSSVIILKTRLKRVNNNTQSVISSIQYDRIHDKTSPETHIIDYHIRNDG